MEIKTDPVLLDARLANLDPTSEDYQKIVKAAQKRTRKKEKLRSRQRNAKTGKINAYKLAIINDMFEKEPKGHAYQDSNGRSYYTLNGTTVRL